MSENKQSTPWDRYYGKIFEKTKIAIALTETERSYLAGIIDGEGSISFSQSTAKGRAFLCVPKLYISNTSEELCKWLTKKLSAVPLKRSRQKLNPKWRTVYVYRIVGYAMAPILEAVLPYLIIKRKQAELMLADPVWKARLDKTRSVAEMQEVVCEFGRAEGFEVVEVGVAT